MRFVDLDKRHVLKWLVTLFDMRIDNEGYESNLEDKLIEMQVDIKTNVVQR